MSLVVAKKQKIETLRTECSSVLAQPFPSNSVRVGASYPAGAIDQQNLLQAAIVGGKLWFVQDSAWQLVEHSAAEAAAVLMDFRRWKDGYRQRLTIRIAAVEEASSIEDVDAVEL